MNNAMYWFDPVPGRVNSIVPGKTGVNNMTPALVMDSDGVRMSVGASGGRRITNCVSQLIAKVFNYGMGPQEAIDSPRIDCSLPVTYVDPRIPAEVVAELESRGHGIHTIESGHIDQGFTSFASPLAIVREPGVGFRAGVDAFHSAYAEGV
jgi:gamma-glutamyltranspeptidase/glutathione hydrolase